VHRSRIVSITALVVAAAIVTGCGAQESAADRRERATSAIEACRDHEGVAAFDDDAVICTDGTFAEERGAGAVAACRERDGVSAFDDDIVICRDGTFHFVEGG
jgi:hypothetical protein